MIPGKKYKGTVIDQLNSGILPRILSTVNYFAVYTFDETDLERSQSMRELHSICQLANYL